nr:hypothetical protein [uncultured Flavobacterium sp.]
MIRLSVTTFKFSFTNVSPPLAKPVEANNTEANAVKNYFLHDFKFVLVVFKQKFKVAVLNMYRLINTLCTSLIRQY